ncbi:MAG: zinc-finger domain-containing protein [Acetobacter sp.]|jgi:uncharacterized Zn-finger protein|nr:zinc-finger domain-containing protein [Acetobacter sp.]MCH4061091.1 zinc-finger domain-containing protein [Acetobacter sp.]MCH4088030.1 zinc-finger domain-containing protein [Acetobacter sp.]MCI1293356.1 zinc-finger domain-containing protein [Acetobacter sp.]MCI1320019.1 zinc-finger domain-containing protein [Acetobacter sp.]
MLIQPVNPSPKPRLGHVETIIVHTRRISCDGGLGQLGHPKVWLKIGGEQNVCPYCSRLFILDPNAVHDNAH